MKRVFAAAFALILLTSSTAFAQRADRNVDMPIIRSFHWFDYVGGDDIRQACGKDGRNRLRLVYNAIYDEQVRAYEPVLRWADIETLHDLRIAGKWLRYTMEFVREALGPDSAPLIAASIFLDILNVFFFFLRIFSGSRD